MDTGNRKYLPNPRDTAGILSVIFYVWTLPLFRKGYEKILELSDVFHPRRGDRSETLGQRLEQHFQNEQKKSRKRSLLRAIVKTFWREYSITGFMYFLNEATRVVQPILLGRLLLYFRKDSDMPYDEALTYACLMVALAGFSALMLSHYFLMCFCNANQVRVAVCNLIYKKSLRLSHSALHDTSPGKFVNLLSNDVSRFNGISSTMHSLWVAPLLTAFSLYFLWQEIQWAAILGSLIFFTMIPIQSYIGKLAMKFGFQTALRTDERIRFMDEIISGVQVIKMYAWEHPFAKLVTAVRQLELRQILKTFYTRIIYMSLILFTTRAALFCAILASILLYGQASITVAKIFRVAAYYNVLSYALTEVFVRAVADVATTLVAFRRLQNFLNYEEKKEINNIDGSELIGDEKKKNLHNEELEQRNLAVSVKSASANWVAYVKLGKDAKMAKSEKSMQQNGKGVENNIKLDDDNLRPPTLHNIDLDVPKGKLIGIIGPVGAGKSSLLQALLRELPLESGSIRINGTVSYACQEAWIFAGSVRQNILFGQEMDRTHYDAVIKSCDLTKDLQSFANGDLTMIGERGASLSGGQKARINLARAVYRRADVYLLDDPLSAVDAHVGLHLFNECLGPKGQLARQNATRILVTHQVHFLKEADWVVIMRDGKIEVQGTNSDIQASGVDFSTLLSSVDEDYEDEITAELSAADDASLTGNRSQTNSESAFKRIGSRISISSRKKAKDDEAPIVEENDEQMHALEESSKGKIKGPLLFHYLKSAEKPILVFLTLVLFLLAQTLASGTDFWVAKWTQIEEQRTFLLQQTNNASSAHNVTAKSISEPMTSDTTETLLSTKACSYIHAALLLALFIGAFIRSLSYYNVCLAASQKLHDALFKGLISTTMRFFDTNPSGRILNRFSKDMNETDEYLSRVLLDALQMSLLGLGAVAVTVIINPLYIVPILIIVLIVHFLRKIYMKSSRNLKRLEGMTKSPVFTHIAATMGGLSTIRAFNAENILLNEFDKHQDLYTSCWIMYISAGSAFALTLDILVFLFTTCVIFSFLLLDTGVSGEKVGLAITQALVLCTQFKWAVLQTAELENHLMAVERILDYKNLDPEKECEEPAEVPPEWPSKGEIEFRKVFYKYFDEAEPVLRGITFSVQAKEKIGIVGRTGAGKSSLIGSLFRLACVDGEIFIDDIETSKLRLRDLRSKIAIIPQDPVLFSGTLRRNLDPFEEYSDDDIWKSLDDVKLEDITSGQAGLESTVMARGANFSVGQRQLLCLARAILRKNRILVLDEATANVDPHTDTLIQQTIREKFAECTVMTIAHRLHTIIDSDRILVMDAGQAVEFDSAHSLLQNDSGIFKSMVEALGPQEFERLNALAKEKFSIN